MNLFVIRKQADRVLYPLVSTVALVPLSPNAWTLVGTLSGLACGIALFYEQWLLGVVFLALRGLVDHVDGFVARTRHLTSRFGAVLDDVSDRWVLGVMYGGGCLALARTYPHLLIVLPIGLTGSFVNVIAKDSIYRQSFDECKTENDKIGHPIDNVGIFGTAEFMIYFGVPFLVMSFVDRPIIGAVGIWLVAIISHISMLQRMIFALRYRRLR